MSEKYNFGIETIEPTKIFIFNNTSKPDIYKSIKDFKLYDIICCKDNKSYSVYSYIITNYTCDEILWYLKKKDELTDNECIYFLHEFYNGTEFNDKSSLYIEKINIFMNKFKLMDYFGFYQDIIDNKK